MATILGVLIVRFLSRHLSDKKILIIALIIYLLVSLRSSYYSLFLNNTYITTFVNYYETIFKESFNSFPMAIIWIILGKMIAYNSYSIKKMSRKILLLIISASLLYLEWILVFKLNGTYNNDCYIFLVPISIVLFLIIKDMKINLNPKIGYYLRKMSTIIYALHLSLICLIRDILGINMSSLLLFVVILTVTILVSLIIFKLEKIRVFKWLKYAH